MSDDRPASESAGHYDPLRRAAELMVDVSENEILTADQKIALAQAYSSYALAGAMRGYRAEAQEDAQKLARAMVAVSDGLQLVLRLGVPIGEVAQALRQRR